MLNMKSVAILLTVHNRKEKTYKCLNSVYKNIGKITEYDFDVYLTDDGSTDGTYTMVKENFSKVKVIKGNGNLFWCRGMYVAWKEACNTKDYDYYICDYCKSEIRLDLKQYERSGGIVILPHTLTRCGNIAVALCNKCVKKVQKELEERLNKV